MDDEQLFSQIGQLLFKQYLQVAEVLQVMLKSTFQLWVQFLQFGYYLQPDLVTRIFCRTVGAILHVLQVI